MDGFHHVCCKIFPFDAIAVRIIQIIVILSQIMGNIYCGDVRLQFLYSLQDSLFMDPMMHSPTISYS